MFVWAYPAQVSGLAWWPVALVVLLLVALNVINNRVAPNSHYLLWTFGGSVALLAIGLLDGNSFTDMGLGVHYLVRGAIWAGVSIGLITAVYLVGSMFRRTREAFHNEDMGRLSPGKLLFQALIEVPFGTVVLEEIAFRSVLFAMLVRRYGLVWGLVIGALLFGLWHILPSMGTHEANPALVKMVGTGVRGNILAVALSVLTTAGAGILFSILRVVSGSVLAPMGFHWATNGLGYAFSWILIRERNRRRAVHRRRVRQRRHAEAEVAGQAAGQPADTRHDTRGGGE